MNSDDPQVPIPPDAQPITGSEGNPTDGADAAQVESEAPPVGETSAELEDRIAQLRQEEQALKAAIAALKAEQARQVQAQLEPLIQESLGSLEQRRQKLQLSVEQLERRQERIRAEMRTTFAGVSQDLAIRVQGFKDYLVGSLQDLVAAAEELPLIAPQAAQPPPEAEPEPEDLPQPRFAESTFQDQAKRIRSLLDRYRNSPDYYGRPWQLRRTFEPIHADRVSDWFFDQGGRGALRSMGSRLQNALIASAVISVLWTMYRDRLRVLLLANSPERLGEWRRGLQDCLGISRSDFGPDQGVALFESPESLIQRADRILKAREMPLIIVDESEDKISLGLLQFPLWLAFAPDPQINRGAYYS